MAGAIFLTAGVRAPSERRVFVQNVSTMRKAQVAIASARRSKKKDEPVSIERKKQTPDEIALTAKNYRLAKELVGDLSRYLSYLSILEGKPRSIRMDSSIVNYLDRGIKSFSEMWLCLYLDFSLFWAALAFHSDPCLWNYKSHSVVRLPSPLFDACTE